MLQCGMVGVKSTLTYCVAVSTTICSLQTTANSSKVLGYSGSQMSLICSKHEEMSIPSYSLT